MSPEKKVEISRSAANRISAWCWAAMVTFGLGAAPLVPAHAEREGHNGEDDRPPQDGTTLSIPLSGTGVQAHATVPKAGSPDAAEKVTVKSAATAGGEKDSAEAHKQPGEIKDEGRDAR